MNASTAKRVCHRRGVEFAEKIYCLAQTYASLRIEPCFVFVWRSLRAQRLGGAFWQ